MQSSVNNDLILQKSLTYLTVMDDVFRNNFVPGRELCCSCLMNIVQVLHVHIPCT